MLIHPNERKTLRQIVSRRLKGKAVPQKYEIRRLRKDGKTIWCEIMVTSIQYAGRPAITGNIIDITERKWAQEKIQWKLAVSMALTSLSNALIDPSSSIQDIANTALEYAKILTNSKHGCVSSIDSKTGDTERQALTSMMVKACLVSGKDRQITLGIGPDERYPEEANCYIRNSGNPA